MFLFQVTEAAWNQEAPKTIPGLDKAGKWAQKESDTASKNMQQKMHERSTKHEKHEKRQHSFKKPKNFACLHV